MPEDLEQQILDYVEGHNTMTLGTCGDDVPWAATVFYASDGLDLYFFSDPQSRHCQNLKANSKVGVTIQEDYRDWRTIKGIQMEGEVVEVGTVIKKAKAMAVYARKYPEVIKLFSDPGSGAFHRAFLKIKTYCVKPARVLYIDNEQGFGKRQELQVG
ncbi:MAG: pyridoxamine 5'-phosphate oxidase family protein [Planctomycetota bacterium]|jgi:uncharacterized protein YhbP (UPF0306 family)